MHGKYILSIDAGTTNCKAVIFDSDGKIMGKAAVRMETFYPREGWVEQNPYFIISSVKSSIRGWRRFCVPVRHNTGKGVF